MDRPANELAVTQLNRFNYAQPATSRYNNAAQDGASPINRTLQGDQNQFPLQSQKAIIDAPLKRKFCGGTSKPYGKK